jgi:RimJ/RimL family protein N-acetyltransferase
MEVWTTKPAHQNLDPFFSERLLFRTLVDSDFPAYRTILSQEETMTKLGVGPMLDEKGARSWFNQVQESWTRVGIFLKKSDGTEGELIGEGGVYKQDKEWNEIFYGLKKEFWGKGYASEFVEKFKEIWWNLPRTNTRIFVQCIYLDTQDTSEAKERLCATIKTENMASQRVVKKTGFELKGELKKGEVIHCFWQCISPKKPGHPPF